MNTISTLEVEYLKPNRTIETVSIKNGKLKKLLWIYNYEGTHFRVFDSLKEVIEFSNSSIEAKHSFDKENELDNFLLNLHFV